MRHKIILSAMLSGLFLLTGCMEDPDFFTPLSEQADSGNIASDVVYNGILESLQNRSEHSEYSGYVDAETAEMAVAEIRRSHPEFFWIDGYVVSSGISGSEISIVTLNGLTSEDLDEMTRELEAAADSLISEIPDSLDDYGKIIYVHDYIIYNTVYDNYGAASEENGLWGTAYGCLVEGNAVCQGYSEAFQYIMNRLDIPCGIATGMAWSGNPYSQSGETAEMLPHAWNYVQINGKYYWIDVTWDDPEGQAAGSPIMHTYCLVDDERILRTRTLDSGQKGIPHCYSMNDNYYVRNNAYITLYSPEAVAEAMAASSDKGEAEFMFADENVYNSALDGLLTQGGLWSIADYADIGESVNYTKDDNMYVLKIDY